MSDFATKDDLKKLENKFDGNFDTLSKKIDSAVDDLSAIIQSFATQTDDRFTEIESRLDRIETNIDRLTNTIDGFVKRLDEHETENTARDAQFARLLDWAEKVSEETGIPLPSLK